MNSNDQKILDEIEQAAKKFSNYWVSPKTQLQVYTLKYIIS